MLPEAEFTPAEEKVIKQLYHMPRRLAALGYPLMASAIHLVNRAIERGDVEALVVAMHKFDRAHSNPERN